MSAPFNLDLPQEGAASDGHGVPMHDFSLYGPIDVVLDGVPVEHAIAYSVPRGWVVRHITDARGVPVRNGRGILSEKLTGEVKVQRKVREVAV